VGVHQRDAAAFDGGAGLGLAAAPHRAPVQAPIHFQSMRSGAAFELPPGASFDPDPQTGLIRPTHE
jgi:putative (di)nucleoside polyphosphate hydrolase